MLRYTAGYVLGNSNFVIQNVNKAVVKNAYTPMLRVLQNILQRGCPTRMSAYLQEQLPGVRREDALYLVDDEVPNWHEIIKGDDTHHYYPARTFFYELVPMLKQYAFIQALLLPEAFITEITGSDKEFKRERVDFYLPQARLVIEIDGGHHQEQIQHDRDRDTYLEQFGILTIRIATKDLELRNESFRESMNEIFRRCRQYEDQLRPFRDAYHTFEKNNISRATAVLRWQLTILALIERGVLSLEETEWVLQVHDHEQTDGLALALQDLEMWFVHGCKLHKLPFVMPRVKIMYTDTFNGTGVKIDFSLRKRWTTVPAHASHIVVRTDYFDQEEKDYFSLHVADPIAYKIIQEGEDSDIPSLQFFLKNLFGYDDFNNGQLSVIVNAMSGRDTIGLLPTGGGKSLCYQFVAMMQPCPSFVVVPIKSLMYDQIDNLQSRGVTRTNLINGDQMIEEKNKIQKDFAQGKYWFVIISPERFQVKEFRQYVDALNKTHTVALAVIDEVHCLSEWGHDFRTSYLHLVKTIRKYCPAVRFLGLTATASKNVLQDISVEMNVGVEDVKTILTYTRPELAFEVHTFEGVGKYEKKRKMYQLLDEMKQQHALEIKGDETESGLIFTTNVNGERGCYELANDLSRVMETTVKYYAGSKPKKATLSEQEYNQYKKVVQEEYKNNEFPLLIATKAFGMGVDKPNVRYTIHYGIPGSLESLYQEAGRAGRDKKDAVCYVLYDKDQVTENDFQKLFELDTTIEDIQAIQKRYKSSESRDILGNFFLWGQNNKGVVYETDMMKRLFQVAAPGKVMKIRAAHLGIKFSDMQKAIYRLGLLGVVKDWVITGWDVNGELEVEYSEFDEEIMFTSLLSYIRKYDKEFSLQEATASNRKLYEIYRNKELDTYEKMMRILVQWSYDNIFYQRRQALKTLDELCTEHAEGKITNDDFKHRIESYFCFNDHTYLLDHISQSPREYERWFELLMDKDELKTKEEIVNIEATLVRFLESYRYNTGLNFVSGVVRLYLDRFTNIDGRERLIAALQQITTYTDKEQETILAWLLQIGQQLDEKNKNHLGEVLCQFFSPAASTIYEALADQHSLFLVLQQTESKLTKIGEQLYDGYSKVKSYN